MGRITVRFTATRNGKRLRGTALVDSGADTTVLSMSDACRLGIDIFQAKPVARTTAGGGRLAGLQLTNVEIVANRRRATLNNIFIPLTRIIQGRGGNYTQPVSTSDPPLLGQDFLQASRAYLDFATDTLRGVEELGPPISLTRKTTQRPANEMERELIRALASCPVEPRLPAKRSKRKKRRR